MSAGRRRLAMVGCVYQLVLSRSCLMLRHCQSRKSLVSAVPHSFHKQPSPWIKRCRVVFSSHPKILNLLSKSLNVRLSFLLHYPCFTSIRHDGPQQGFHQSPFTDGAVSKFSSVLTPSVIMAYLHYSFFLFNVIICS